MNRKRIFSKMTGNDKNKPWLVMVHGFTQNHKIFDRQVTVFSEKFNIILLDLRGHGGSSHIQGPFGIEEYTDNIPCWETPDAVNKLVDDFFHPIMIIHG